jgi:hypothetical protein
MYPAAGHDLGAADDLPFVAAIGDVAAWPALATWLIASVAMLADLTIRCQRCRRQAPPR